MFVAYWLGYYFFVSHRKQSLSKCYVFSLMILNYKSAPTNKKDITYLKKKNKKERSKV